MLHGSVCVMAGVWSRGKLVDALNPAQFDRLVHVLSHPSSKRDFKLLLSSANIWEVVDSLKEFIPQKVLR